MTKLVSWRMVGARYTRNGIRYPGFKGVTVEGEERERYHTETETMKDIIAGLEAEGVDCSIWHHWVKTGEGASFGLTR